MKKGGDTVTVVVVLFFFEQTESVLEKAGSRLAVECDGDGMAIFESCQERGCMVAPASLVANMTPKSLRAVVT